MTIQSSRVWHLPPSGRVKRNRRVGSFDITFDDSFITDKKARVVAMEGITRGSLVFSEFQATDEPYTLSFSERFLENGPVALARFVVETPEGWSVNSAWLRQTGPDPVVQGTVRTWEIRDLPGPEEERLGESSAERAPILMLALVPPAGASVKPVVLSSWKSLSGWYQELARGRDAVTPEIADAASKASGSPDAGLFEQLEANARFVRDKVRYIARELGIGSYQPSPAEQTLHNRYGDCKDKSTLFQSMLASRGIPSYPVLINFGQSDTVDTDIASPQSFNHLIVAVPLPDGAVIPASVAHAVGRSDALGALLFVDTTNEYASFGSLSAGLTGNRGLVVAGERSQLVELPGDDPAAHRIERHMQAEISDDRMVRATLTSEYFGEPASMARQAYRQSAEDHRKDVEQELREAWDEARTEDYAAVSETADGKFVETVSFEAGPLGEAGPHARVPLFPGARDLLPRVPLSRRKTAVVYRFPRVLRFETNLKGFPDTARVPSPQAVQSSGWSITTDFTRDTEGLRAIWELRLSRTRFEPEAFEELRKLWSAADRTARLSFDATSR